MLRTKVDKLVEVIKKEGTPTIHKVAHLLNISTPAAEAIASALEKAGVLKINYPLNVMQKPTVQFIKMPDEIRQSHADEQKGKIISTYSFKADSVPATVEIIDTGQFKLYKVSLVELTMATRIFLDQIKEQLVKNVPPESSQVSDVEKMEKIRKEFFDSIKDFLLRFELGIETADMLAGLLLHSMFGLGELDLLNRDDWLEEISVNNAKTPIAVYHRKIGWMRSNVYMPDEAAIFNYASQIARRVGRQIATLTPILDARLETGDRVCATLQPISSHGNTITIRRFARVPWTIVRLLLPSAHTMSLEMASMIWQGFNYEMNLMCIGGTASGKTSALNSIAAFIPPNQRILTIEDTREIMLPKHQWNWVPMLTRKPNPEGQGEITMLDLIITSLRMRPDRIFVGEIRKQKEAEVAFEAMHTGHSVYSTFHSDTASQALRRMINPPVNLPPSDLESLHILMVQFRDRRRNLRRTLEIAEVQQSAGGEVEPNIVFRWRPRTDTWEKVSEPTGFIKELNLHTGMTKEGIAEDNYKRQTILKWMIKNKIVDIDIVGNIFSIYYSSPDELYEIARKNLKIPKGKRVDLEAL